MIMNDQRVRLSGGAVCGGEFRVPDVYVVSLSPRPCAGARSTCSPIRAYRM